MSVHKISNKNRFDKLVITIGYLLIQYYFKDMRKCTILTYSKEHSKNYEGIRNLTTAHEMTDEQV